MKSPPRPTWCKDDDIVLTFDVAREHAGMRLDRFVQNRIPRLSRTRATRVVRNCAFHASGKPRRPSERVRAGEVVLIVRPALDEPKVPLHFDVLHEDAHVLAIDKAPGLPMHPTATYYRNTLSFLLQSRYPERTPQFAHRLDRETSGLVVCGWTTQAEVALKTAFEKRRVKKRYVAIVEGRMNADEGEIDAPLGNVQQGLHIMMEVREGALPSKTRYEVLERSQSATLVQLHPHTGRQHQLRVHLAHIGHPIVGDKLYGPRGSKAFIDYMEGERSDALLKALGHPRHALHAQALRIAHPNGSGDADYEAPIPWDMARLWEARRQG
ncbi:MAG: RluA family pseudouridine synthase, partial [Myxococcota bacterium]